MNRLLRQLVTFPTVTADKEANRGALLWCQRWLREKGINSQLEEIAGRPLLGWGAPARSARVMLNTHIDVVPGPAGIFRPRRVGNRLFGRGTADTKAMAAAFLSIPAGEIKRAAARGIRFVLVTDEETGGESTKQLLSRLPKLEFALFGEPTNLEISHAAKGIMQVKLAAGGAPAHGSRTWLGKNAIIELSRRLQTFLADNPLPTGETWETTFNFSMVSGGSAINQVPTNCELWCDVRLNPEDRPAAVQSMFERHFGLGNVTIARSESSIFTPTSDPRLAQLAAAIRNQKLPVKFRKEFGSSDARHCTAIGIPTAVFGPVGGGLHEDGEWVDLESMGKARQVVREVIKKL